MSGWGAWDDDGDDEDWGGSRVSRSREPREQLPRSGLNWLAVATLTALLAWVIGMVFAGWYVQAVGYPPISFDHDLDYVAPTDLQNHVKGVWGALEVLSLPVAIVAVVLSGVAFRLRRERVTAVVALGASLVSAGLAVFLAVSGMVDLAFRP